MHDEPDSVQQFAADLRKLRLDADSPTLARLQSETGISKSVISDAFSGRNLPSARTVDRVVRACGGNSAKWVSRRDALVSVRAAAVAEDVPVVVGTPPGTEPAAPARRSGRFRAFGWVAAGFVLGAVVSAVVTALVVSQTVTGAEATASGEEPRIVVETGEDPGLTSCVDDARVVTGGTRADNSLLEIVWSDTCYAGWGRITRYDGLSYGNTVTIAIYPQTAPDGPERQEATEHDVQSAYTTFVVRPSPDTLLCADGSFTVDGKRIDLGDPLCS